MGNMLKVDGLANTPLFFKRLVFRVPHYKSYPQEFADCGRRTGKVALAE